MRSLFALAICALAILISSSNSYPQPQSKSENKITNQDKRGTQESPLIIHGDITTKAAEKPESDRKQEEEKIEIERSLAKYAGWTAVITGVLVLVTGVLAFVTFKLWRSTNKLVAGAEDTAERQLRAYVFAGKIMFYYRPIANGERRYYFQLTWDNSGTTPTKQLTTHTNFILRDDPLPETFNFRYETDDISRALIGPKSSVLGPVIPLEGIRPVDLRAVHEGAKFAYIWGWLRYHDVFKGTPQHITRYCYQIVVNGTPMDPGEKVDKVDFMYPIYPKNNCADEECDQ